METVLLVLAGVVAGATATALYLAAGVERRLRRQADQIMFLAWRLDDLRRATGAAPAHAGPCSAQAEAFDRASAAGRRGYGRDRSEP